MFTYENADRFAALTFRAKRKRGEAAPAHFVTVVFFLMTNDSSP
jgi:hypothetical protein